MPQTYHGNERARQRTLRMNKALMVISTPEEITELIAASRDLWNEVAEFKFEDPQADPAALLTAGARLRKAQMIYDEIEV